MVLKCQQMEMIHIKQEFVGGLNMPEAVRIFPPSIRLRLTEDSMEFRPRYGLERFFGPWTVERQLITHVYREQRGLNLFQGLGIVSDDGRWWTFYTYRPNDVLRCLKDLGYPVA
jgi:hypothetical protein